MLAIFSDMECHVNPLESRPGMSDVSSQPPLSGISGLSFGSTLLPHSGELRMQKLKSHLVRKQSLNVLPL